MSQNLLKISEILKNDYKPALENQIGIVRIGKAWDDLISFFLDYVEIFYL